MNTYAKLIKQVYQGDEVVDMVQVWTKDRYEVWIDGTLVHSSAYNPFPPLVLIPHGDLP